MVNVQRHRYQQIEKTLLDSFLFEDKLLAIFESRGKISSKKEERVFEISNDYIEFSKQLTTLLTENITKKHIDPFVDTCQNFKVIRSLLDNYQEKLLEIQDKDRFYSLDNDSFWTRLTKIGKRFSLKVNWFFVDFGNIFRKRKKEKQFWLHQVPEAALAESVFLNLFLTKLLPVYKRYLQHREERKMQFYMLDRQMEEAVFFSSENAEVEELVVQLKEGILQDKEYLSNFFISIDDELEAEFADKRSKINTIEFAASTVKRKKLDKNFFNLLRKYDSVQHQLQFVGFAIAEHWRLKLQNRELIFQLLEQFEIQNGELSKQIDQVLRPAFIELKKELQLFASQSGSDEFFLHKDVTHIKESVSKKIPALMRLLIQSRISYLFDKPLIELEKALHAIPETHEFASVVFQGKMVGLKNFKIVKSRQLLQDSVFIILKEQFVFDQKEFAAKLQQLNSNLSEIQHVVDYTIDYYLEEGDKENGLYELEEGLKRSVRKSEDNLTFLADIEQKSFETLKQMCLAFAEKTLQYFEPGQLHQSEKINQRRAYISQKKMLLLKGWQYIFQIYKKSVRWVKEAYIASNDKYFNLRNLLGISYEKEPISTELSNYLSETRQAIQRLPVMYQKLFENSPLMEERFYIPRKTELKQLSEAFENWKKGNFAPSCLVGEQGSGATTVFNFFTYLIQDEVEVGHYVIKQNKCKEDDFMAFFRDVFPDFKGDSFEKLIVFIHAIPEKRVIILENIHNLFIRKNGAFGNLYLLFKLMSLTNKKIFWVCSCFIYSWKMLDYTLSISGYFAYIIHFEKMSKEMIGEAIMKRHKVSGFNLYFNEPEDFSPKRSYFKLTDDEKQDYLKDLFFEELWQHAQSNMTMAFIFWLRAIVKVEVDTLFIRQRQLSFNFLNSLKIRELTSLHGILVHGGLTINEHASVFNLTIEESARHLMNLDDDGLLELRGDKYFINPLLYRTLVSQLKSLNFIY